MSDGDDPLTDPRAAMLAACQPDEILDWGKRFTQMAHDCTDLYANVQAIIHASESGWEGQAASAFQTYGTQATNLMPRWGTAYEDAAYALNTYGNAVAGTRGKWQPLIQEYEHAVAKISADNATVEKYLKKDGEGSDQYANAYNSRLNDYANKRQLAKEIFTLYDRFDDERKACVSALSTAIGTMPSDNWKYPSVNVGEQLEGILKNAWDQILAIPGDLKNWWEHPTDLHDIGKLASDLGGALLSIGAIAAVLVAGPEAGALTSTLEKLADLTTIGGRTALGVGLAADLKDGDTEAVLQDLEALSLDGLGSVGSAAAKTAAKNLESAGSAAAKVVEDGGSLSDLTAEQRAALEKAGVDPSEDPATRQKQAALSAAVYEAAKKQAAIGEATSQALQFGGLNWVQSTVSQKEHQHAAD